MSSYRYIGFSSNLISGFFNEKKRKKIVPDFEILIRVPKQNSTVFHAL